LVVQQKRAGLPALFLRPQKTAAINAANHNILASLGEPLQTQWNSP
jgi:hypothetical protein